MAKKKVPSAAAAPKAEAEDQKSRFLLELFTLLSELTDAPLNIHHLSRLDTAPELTQQDTPHEDLMLAL